MMGYNSQRGYGPSSSYGSHQSSNYFGGHHSSMGSYGHPSHSSQQPSTSYYGHNHGGGYSHTPPPPPHPTQYGRSGGYGGSNSSYQGSSGGSYGHYGGCSMGGHPSGPTGMSNRMPPTTSASVSRGHSVGNPRSSSVGSARGHRSNSSYDDRGARRDRRQSGSGYAPVRSASVSGDYARSASVSGDYARGADAGRGTSVGRGRDHRRETPPVPFAGSSASPEGLSVSGCQHATVGGIVCGEFSLTGLFHGRPIYRKNKQVNGLDVMLYFWDDRDGLRYSGWWFGPKAGGEQIWAYHPDRDSQAPPSTGWQVPYNGPVDPSFTVSLRWSAGSSGGHQQQQQQGYGGGWSRGREAEPDRRDAGRRENERRREEERREEDRRRREAEDRRRREAEDWRRQEHERQREQEARRRQEEEGARKARESQQVAEDMEKKRRQQQVQQKAALAIRRVIQKIRSATADTFETIRQELEETLRRELDNTGSQKQRIWQESNEGLEQGRRRIEAEGHKQKAMAQAATEREQQYKKVEDQKRAHLEEQRRRVEEARKKQQEETEKKKYDIQQKKEEEEKRKQDVQQKRIQENKSTLEIRKTIQKIRVSLSREQEVTPDYEQLKTTLETALREELEKTGSMKSQLQEESAKEMGNLERRLEMLRTENDKKETAVKLVQDLEQLVEVAEASVQKLQTTMALLDDKSESTVMDVEKVMEDVQEVSVEAQTSVLACADVLKEKAWEVKDWETKQSLQKLQRRTAQCSQTVDAAMLKVKQAKDAAIRCALAWQKTREIQGIFFKYGTSDTLTRKEVVTFAKRELKYDVQANTLDGVWRELVPEGERGVKMEHFHLLKAAIGVARELERDAKRCQERKERDRAISEMKADLQQKAKAVAFPVDEAERSVDAAEKQVNPLSVKAKTMPSNRMVAVADQTDRMINEARACVEHARESINRLGEDSGERFKADVKTFLKGETKHLELKLGRMDRRIVRAANLSAQFRARVGERHTAELNRLRKVARNILRYNQGLRGQTSEELFLCMDSDGNGEIDEKEFVSFFETVDKDIDIREMDDDMAEHGAAAEGEGSAQKNATDEQAKGKLPEGSDKLKERGAEEEGEKAEKADEGGHEEEKREKADGQGEGEEPDDEAMAQVDLSPESLSKLFAFMLEDGSTSISKEEFTHFIRVYYQVVKPTAITDSRSICDSSTLRRLDVKEVVEVLEGPVKEGSVDVKRIQARAMKDQVEGWITTCGNMGTVFLKEGGAWWKVVKETILTEAFDVGESKETTTVRETVRKLKPGELLQVYEWPRKDEASGLTRMRAKVKSDRSIGWVTTVGNQGTVFATLV